MTIISQIKSKSKNTFYGWWVVAASSFCYFQGIGGVFYGFSTFFNPLIAEFGWTRAAISGVFSMQRLEGGLEGLVAGPMIDRFGARKVMLVGITVAAIGFFVLGLFVNENIVRLYLIFGVLVAMGYNAGYSTPANAVAAKWFIRRRGLAFAIVAAGGGLGGAVLVPFIAWVITQLGWRSAAEMMGVLFLTLGLPMLLIIRSKPEDKGLLPDGETAPEAAEEVRLADSGALTYGGGRGIDFTVGEALRTVTFWVYIVGMMLRACVLSSIVIHQMPHLVDMGIDYQVAAEVLGYMVLMSVPGRLIGGWLSDMLDKRLLMFISCLFQATGMWIFIHASTLGTLYLFVVVYGLGYGAAIPLTQALQAELFGRRRFATLNGIRQALVILPTVGAPVLLGHLYDITHSYNIGFYALVVICLLAGFTFLLIRQPKPPAKLTGKGGHDANTS